MGSDRGFLYLFIFGEGRGTWLLPRLNLMDIKNHNIILLNIKKLTLLNLSEKHYYEIRYPIIYVFFPTFIIHIIIILIVVIF